MEVIVVLLAWLLQGPGLTLARHLVNVTIALGQLQGYRERVLGKDIDIFLGVPFAQPPVGELRFSRPRELRRWQGIKHALKLPPSCYQAIDTAFDKFEGVDMWNPNTEMSEDCLYLNIWAPSSRTSQPRAVLVWIFGGGFYSGTSTLDLYDSRILASKTDVVVVSMQYRVGALGFTYLGRAGAPGNQGLVDQQMALQWVFNHIRHFGGDGSRITVFGESAGAVSASFHLISPLSQQLVKHAIMQSGSALCPWAVDSNKVAMNRSIALSKLVGCPGREAPTDEVLKCLRKADPQALSDRQWDLKDFSTINTPLVPTVDGYFLRETPQQTIQRGAHKRTSILLGSNTDEGNYFLAYSLPHIFKLSMDKRLSEDQYRESVRVVTNSRADLVLDTIAFEYGTPHNFSYNPRYRDVMDDLLGDVSFICPVVDFADAYSPDSRVFLYRFKHRTTANPWPKWMGVMHGYEIDHVFGAPSNTTLSYTNEEKVLSDQMIQYWSNFAKTGDPNIGEDNSRTEFVWPAYRTESKEYIILDTKPLSTGRGLRDRQCTFWREIVPQLRQAAEPRNNPHSLCGCCGLQTTPLLAGILLVVTMTISLV